MEPLTVVDAGVGDVNSDDGCLETRKEKKYYRSAMCSMVGERRSGVVDAVHLPSFPQNSPQLSDAGS